MYARGPFVMLPKCIDDFKLSPVAFRLYYAYKSVCGESPKGRCWKTRQRLADSIGVSKPTLDKAYRELNRKGLIESDKVLWRGGRYRLMVRIVDLWNRNEAAAAVPKPVSRSIRDGEHARTVRRAEDSYVSEPQRFAASPDKDFLPCAVNGFVPNKNTRNKRPSHHSTSLGEGKTSRSSKGCKATGERSGGNERRNFGTTGTMTIDRKGTEDQAMRGFDVDGDQVQQAETYDEKAAKKLIDAVAGKLRLMRRAEVRVWSKDIKQFREKNGVSEADFDEILSWYIAHIGDQYIPMVHSAKSFCEKIDQIGLAKRRTEIDQRAQRGESIEERVERFSAKGICK